MLNNSTRSYRLLAFVVILFAATGCFQQAGEAGFPTPVSQSLPTDTPTPTDTEASPTDTPTTAGSVSSLGQGGAETTQDTGFVFATEPGGIAQLPTQNLSDPFGGTATIEYLISSGQDFYVTATAIIAGATQTVAAQQTGTSQAIFPPTFTPSPTAGLGQTGISQPLLPGQDCIHEVRAEDRNLYRISLRYGSTVRGIAAASGIANINLIRVGQMLTIPGCGTLGVTPPPTSTVPASSTPIGTLVPGTTPVPVTSGRVHMVEQGETLFEISLRYGVPVASIAAANGIANINLIYIGQELVIP